MPCHSVTGRLRQLLNNLIIARQHWSVRIQTYLLILLLHYARTDNKIIYFRSDTSKECKVCNINLLKETLGDVLCNELFFVHAYSGCDSTSRIYGIWKKVSLPEVSEI